MSKSMKLTIIMVVATVIAVAFGTGYQVGRLNQSNILPTVDEASGVIFSDYVDKTKLDPSALSSGAIEGMIKALNDPYTSYLSAKDYQFGMSSLTGEFEGIGAMVAIKDGQPLIVAPTPGSPAERAGIRSGDIILEIDGKSTANMTLTEVVSTIRGPSGTSVKLLIQHQNETKPVEINIVRSRIELSSVHWEMKGDIAYIDIAQFSERTDIELIPALQGLANKQAKGIIIDLRGNPGGILETVVDIASHFIKDGIVVSVVSDQGRQTTAHRVKATSVTTDLPMVVLTDNVSASGSEVLSGTLQDYGRATIAGDTTFGKGSVNILRQLSDGSGIYITIARWLTPKGRLIEGKGIDPDIKLDLKGDAAIDWAIDYLHGKR